MLDLSSKALTVLPALSSLLVYRWQYSKRKNAGTFSINRLLQNIRNSHNDNSNILGIERRQLGNNVTIDSSKIRQSGNSNRRGYVENGSNDNLQERGQINTGAGLNSKYSTALTAGEWKKYNYAITSKVDAGLRISENAILVEGEKGEFNYKLVIYDNTFYEKPISAIYGIGETGFHQDITNFDAKAVAKLICLLEKDY